MIAPKSSTMFEGTTLLITGGCGYIGSNLALELVRVGCDTVVLFDVSAPKMFTSFDSANNTASPEINARNQTIYVNGDICNYGELDQAIKKYNVKGVFHMAGYGLGGNTNLPAYKEDTKRVNIIGTENVIRASITNGVRALGKYI